MRSNVESIASTKSPSSALFFATLRTTVLVPVPSEAFEAVAAVLFLGAGAVEGAHGEVLAVEAVTTVVGRHVAGHLEMPARTRPSATAPAHLVVIDEGPRDEGLGE